MATIQDIYLIGEKASKVLNDLGFCSDKYSISYGLEKSAHKMFYEETGFINEHSKDEEWSSDENYWGTKFQSLIANAIDNSQTKKDTFELLFNKIKSFDNFIKKDEVLPDSKVVGYLLSSVDKFVDSDPNKHNFTNSNANIKWIEDFSPTYVQLAIVASLVNKVLN